MYRLLFAGSVLVAGGIGFFAGKKIGSDKGLQEGFAAGYAKKVEEHKEIQNFLTGDTELKVKVNSVLNDISERLLMFAATDKMVASEDGSNLWLRFVSFEYRTLKPDNFKPPEGTNRESRRLKKN